MTTKQRALGPSIVYVAFVLAASVLLTAASASAATQYLDDGGEQNTTLGTWDMPKSTAAIPGGVSTVTGNLGQGYCSPDGSKLTRPECSALRLVAATNADCATAGGSWTTGSVCNDNVNTAQATCEAAGGRIWNAGTSKCAITMKGYNRNKAVCQNLGGTWAAGSPGTCTGNWLMAPAGTYTPALFTAIAASTSAGPGDQCLRCHNSYTEWNTNRVRDVEGFLKTGHNNMGRLVTPGSGAPWAGPDGLPYTADSNGVLFNWATGTLGGDPVAWIYADWLAPLPRAVLNKPGQSYSCGRCHMTGWVNSADSTMEPEASLPGIRTNVNVTGSWDTWGITCSRCHASAIEDSATGSCSVANLFTSAACTSGGGTWTAGQSPPAYGTGASHHADVTNFDAVSGGYCTNLKLRNANKYTCEYQGGTWYSACDDDRWVSAALCVAANGCINPNNNHALTFTSSSACAAGGECTNPLFTTSASCTAGGGTWTAGAAGWWVAKSPSKWTSSSCSIGGGTCSVAGNTTPAACKDAYGVWSPTWTDLFSCMDAGGYWTGNKDRRGQLITSLCMECHRQETGGNPYDSANPAGNIKVGPYHSTVTFLSHPHANQFLNSPHGKFTGTFSQIGTGKYNFAGTGEYKSFFQMEGEAGNTGNGCTGCHDVHESVVEETGQHHAIHEECTDCHTKNLNVMRHPTGDGTPLEEMASDPMETCVTCHMPSGEHLFRINSDASYATFPAAAMNGTANANTAPDGSYSQAVWVDIDAACGQCHGGGTIQAFANGTTVAGSAVVSVDTTTNFAIGERVRIAGAGNVVSVTPLGAVTREDLDSYVKAVDSLAGTITLAGNAIGAVTAAEVEQNPTKNDAGYMNKATLAGLAAGIHNDAPLVSFRYSLDATNKLKIYVDASASSCNGSNANCDAYTWDWGDATAQGSGKTANHTYATAGTKTVTLTVQEYGVSSGSGSRFVKVFKDDLPAFTSPCSVSVTAGTWSASTSLAASDDKGVRQLTVSWGDYSVVSSKSYATPYPLTGSGAFTHAYAKPGTYAVTQTVIDSAGQKTTQSCNATVSGYTVSGTVTAGGNPVSGAAVALYKVGALNATKTVYTQPDGTYTIGNVKPGSYTLRVTKTGLTFADTAVTVDGNETVDVAAP